MAHEAYLHVDLSGDEDPGLSQDQKYMSVPPEEEYKVPPGIKTLEQWGQQKFPSGKQQGKTSYQVFKEDDGYLMKVKNRKAVSPWMRSFQNYLRAMWKHRCRHQQIQNIDHTKDQKMAQALPKARTSRSMGACSQGKIDETEWEKIPTTEMTTSLKRSPAQIEKGENQPRSMQTEPNQNKIEMIQTQIAILQRELAIETQVPEDQ
jgi:hypothetical protein